MYFWLRIRGKTPKKRLRISDSTLPAARCSVSFAWLSRPLVSLERSIMSEKPSEKPKLIIDDDWKERVQSEKEAAAAEAVASQEETPDAKAHTESPPDDAQPAAELPPASFATLVHSLTAQALASLGQIPNADGETKVEIGLGKHFIDTLVVLEEKTKGNLDQEEAAALAKMVHELRMFFVQVCKEQSAGDDSSSETPSTA
jgi:hypothetical protein